MPDVIHGHRHHLRIQAILTRKPHLAVHQNEAGKLAYALDLAPPLPRHTLKLKKRVVEV
jgi:hypothetical protein